MRIRTALALLMVLTACAVEQEPALAPAPEVEIAPPEPYVAEPACDPGDDGIGGTGCEPEID